LRETKPVFIKSLGSSAFIADIAGCGRCAGQPGHADRSRTARTGIRPPSACSGCQPPRGRAGRREPRQRLRPCGGLPTFWFRARANPQLLTDCRQARLRILPSGDGVLSWRTHKLSTTELTVTTYAARLKICLSPRVQYE